METLCKHSYTKTNPNIKSKFLILIELNTNQNLLSLLF